MNKFFRAKFFCGMWNKLHSSQPNKKRRTSEEHQQDPEGYGKPIEHLRWSFFVKMVNNF